VATLRIARRLVVARRRGAVKTDRAGVASDAETAAIVIVFYKD
tara:strand:+ start:26637 stop:26765 length:129 start_codon:yes stop_codon:yes gene_type:complete